MDPLLIELLDAIVNIYIILLFIRIFVAESERHDASIGLVLQATDPVVIPLRSALRTSKADLTPLAPILALLLFKGMLFGSIPRSLHGFIDTLFQLYMLIMIIIWAFREYYTNPIASFGQRLVNPVRAIAANFTRQIAVVNLLSVVFLIIVHVIVTFILLSLWSKGSGGEVASSIGLKSVFLHSLGLIVNLTRFFFWVILINVLLSWLSPDPLNPIVQLVALISAPILQPLRRLIPPVGGVMDISPIVAILALQVANRIGHNILALF